MTSGTLIAASTGHHFLEREGTSRNCCGPSSRCRKGAPSPAPPPLQRLARCFWKVYQQGTRQCPIPNLAPNSSHAESDCPGNWRLRLAVEGESADTTWRSNRRMGRRKQILPLL